VHQAIALQFPDDLATIQGLEGGYKKWRTQFIDLTPYAEQVIQVQFRFQANAENNAYLGWLIDDVAISHDADRDTLPDELERQRNDIRVSRQIQPVVVPNGGESSSFVRRLFRPEASEFAVEAIISHVQPRELTVKLGWLDASGTSSNRTVFNANGATTYCAAPTARDFIGPAAPVSVARESSSGVVIQVDAGTGNFGATAFSGSRDWFIEVHDTNGADSRIAVIESLRFWSLGQTAIRDADSDYDGIRDGVEVRDLHDPLGYDGDSDGIHETADPDDNTPSWAPALKVA
jgi:hypothetical protein